MGKSEDQTAVHINDSSQYLTFTLNDEEYGLDILKVQEIKGYEKATPLPDTPIYVKGVINLRGTVVPVVDLRTKFSMGEVSEDKETVVIVVMLHGKAVGLLVDAVSDVLSILGEDIQPAPELARGLDSNYISGIGQCGERLVTLLDIEQVLDEKMISG